ncbi:MAG: MOSC domain-containing protein, partial [Vicinamibacterales bacterium]
TGGHDVSVTSAPPSVVAFCMTIDATVTHPTLARLEAALDEIRQAPADVGALELIVRRPAVGVREVLDTAELDVVDGLVGDTWVKRGSSRTPDGRRHPDMQLNIMGVRMIALIAQSRDRWALAGDQLYVDFDLSEQNLPPGARLEIGGTIVEVTPQPHTGCGKFAERFGLDAMTFVNAPLGRSLRLRGLNARVIKPGTIHAGDRVAKVRSPA